MSRMSRERGVEKLCDMSNSQRIDVFLLEKQK